MRRIVHLMSALAVLMLVCAPTLALARAGDAGSLGSRGTRTFSAPPPTNTAPSTVAPMQRSITPQQPSGPSYTAPNPGFAPQPGLAPRSSFMSGLMGGLVGAGIGGLLFGGGLFHGMTGFGGFLGLILQIVLLVVVVRFLVGLFMNRRPALAGASGMSGFNPGAMPASGAAPAAPPLIITPADYQAFDQLLQAVQAAWTQHDLTTLRMVATPEMVSYFGEQLAEQTSRGVRNAVTDVHLEQGDLSESWAEQGREYATVAMRFSMIDVTRDAQGHVVDGSPTEHIQATEVWTFLRAPGGRWLLSAIQQVR